MEGSTNGVGLREVVAERLRTELKARAEVGQNVQTLVEEVERAIGVKFLPSERDVATLLARHYTKSDENGNSYWESN